MVDRDQLIAYLLHQMPEPDRATLAERWMTDPDLHQELRNAEAELLDAYARGELTDYERSQVEFLLMTPAQQSKLDFAKGLAAIFQPRRRWRVSWTQAAAAAAILALGAVSGSLWWINQGLRIQLENARTQPVRTGGLFIATVAPGNLRGASDGHRIMLPATSAILRLDLDLDPGDEKEIYHAALSGNGGVLWSETPIHPEARGSAFVAPVWIPAALLQPGQYQITLEGRLAQVYRFELVR